MTDAPKLRVRTAAKAIIVEDGRLLLTKNRDESGDWYLLPGGGQNHGEALHDTLRRECLEEIGADVTVGRLRFVRDYIGKHHEFPEDAAFHQVEVMFECTLVAPYDPGAGVVPDKYQTGVEWIALTDLTKYRVYPRVLAQLLTESVSDEPSYLGDTN